MEAFILLKRIKHEDPRIGSFTRIEGIVPRSYSTDPKIVQALCDKLNAEVKDGSIVFTVESVSECLPEDPQPGSISNNIWANDKV